jgi:hypothetical protein
MKDNEDEKLRRTNTDKDDNAFGIKIGAIHE